MIQQNAQTSNINYLGNLEIRSDLEHKVARVCLIRLLFLILLLIPLALTWFAKSPQKEQFLFINIAEYTVFLGIGFGLTLFFLLTWRYFSNIIFFFRLQLFSDLVLAALLSLLTGGIVSNFNFVFLAILFLYGRILGVRIANIISVIIGLFFVAISFYQFFLQSGIGHTPDLAISQISYHLFLQFLALGLVLMLLRMGYASEDQLLSDIAKKEKELRRSENLKSKVFDWMNSGLIVTDRSGNISVINRQALIDTGLSHHEEALGKKLHSLFPKLAEMFDHLEKDQNLRTEIKQEDRKFGATFTPIFEENSTLILFSDITRIKEMEERIQQMEKLATIGELAAGLAHEIKNPLAGIKGSLQLINQDTLDQHSRERLYNVIQKDIYRLDHLLKDFLAFARPSQAKKQEIDLQETVGYGVENLQNTAPGVSFYIDRSLEGKKWIWDREQLEQVLMNLLLNAAQASMQSDNAQVEVGHGKNHKGEYIYIRDNGPGFDPKDKKTMFDPFFTTKNDGSGLGLSIAQRLADQNNAWIEILNLEPGGAEARVYYTAKDNYAGSSL
ncbi:MAG: two-component system sensor histidine kinase NtrB [Thermodesulfobacteriota bacterium]